MYQIKQVIRWIVWSTAAASTFAALVLLVGYFHVMGFLP